MKKQKDPPLTTATCLGPMRGLGTWRSQENQMNRLSLNKKAYISLPHHNLAQRSWFEPENTDPKWKLAAFHFSATSTKFSLTLLNAGKTNQGGKNGHFGVMQPSEMFPFSTKTKAESENQSHFAPQIARPWLAPSCWADPTLTHLCESSDPSVTVSSLEKPCFSWCISHTAF